MRLLLFCNIVLYFMMAGSIFAQNQPQKSTAVHIEHADFMRGAARFGKNVQALFGNVKLKHHETLMHCDSAFFYRDSNFVHAYGSIHVIQADSVHLYGNILRYYGNEEKAMVRENVRLVNNDVVLTTEHLDYDRKNDVAYYFNGGKIVSGDNKLTSFLGYYYPRVEEAHFKDSVVVINPDYTIYSDTLQYLTIPKIVKIVGPTSIHSDRNIIYAEAGFYDTEKDIAQLEKKSSVKGEEQELLGDTIFYNRKSGFGEVFSKMELRDSANHVIITGDYGYYNELSREALATNRAVLMQIQQNDTLFLHADTLRLDPIAEDPEFHLIRAFHNVKFFRDDFQGRCDSMVYDLRDSINTFYKDPVLWAMGNQMSANIIKLYTKNQALYKAELINNSFIIAPEDSSEMYNQIKGRNMVGYIRDNELYRIDVDGNSQAIYYPKEKETIIGMNKAEASNMSILLEKQQVVGIILRTQTAGNLNPPLLVLDENRKLVGFRWLEKYRPKSKKDIFIKNKIEETVEQVDYSEFQLDKSLP